MSATSIEVEPVRTLRLANGVSYEYISNTAADLDEIPIIDVSRIYSEDIEDRKAVAREIREAAHDIGFFYVINHGVDMNLASEAFAQAKRFFALPEDKKMEVYTGLVPNEFVGYHPMNHYDRNGWKHKDLSEAFNWGYSPKEDPEATPAALAEDKDVSMWPSSLSGFREALYAYHTPLVQFSRRLTKTFALALELPEDSFDEFVKRPEAGMRILHYPQQQHSINDQNGIGAHTDVECFTIVTQDDSGGLEVLNKSGQWIKAKPVTGAFVVNIADCFMRQTNDFFVSTVHRVINKSGKERYSAPFFWGFDRDMLLEPLPTCVSERHPAKYPVTTMGKYYAWRTNRSLAPLTQERKT